MFKVCITNILNGKTLCCCHTSNFGERPKEIAYSDIFFYIILQTNIETMKNKSETIVFTIWIFTMKERRGKNYKKNLRQQLFFFDKILILQNFSLSPYDTPEKYSFLFSKNTL